MEVSMTSIKDALKEVEAVYDNPNYPDRYIIIMKSGEVYAMSENPLSPSGFNIHVGEFGEKPSAGDGKRVPKGTLPIEVRKAIRERIIK